MTPETTVRALAEQIAAEHGWPLVTVSVVPRGEIWLDSRLLVLAVHPDADTFTLAMNAGKLLPPNR